MSEDPSTILKRETRAIRIQSSRRWLVLATVLSSRTIYTINWFNIGPALVFIGADFGVNLSSLGVLTSSFLLGAGIFQVPAGILSAKWGAKNTSQLGMLILSLSGIGEGLSPIFPILIASRFTLGVGAALFFAPAIGILTPLFRDDEEGLVLGLYNSCFNIGGAIALFGWVIVIEILGWRGSLVLGGLIGLGSVLVSQLVIPRDRLVSGFQSVLMRPVFKNWNIWIISFGVLGLWGGVFTASSLLNRFLISPQQLNCIPTSGSNASCLEFAGLLASSIMFGSIIGGPIGGYLSDRYRNRKLFILVPGVGASIGLLLFSFSSPIGLAFLIPLVGFLDAIVFSTMYASPSQYPEIGKRYAPLGISIINCVQILGSFGIPIVFTALVMYYGENYSPGWFFTGGFAIAMMLLVVFLKEPFKAGSNQQHETS
jgi:MFS family permease